MKLYIKLNIQRFATTVTVDAYETGVDTNNNLSYIYATFTQVASSNTWNSSGSAYYNISCDGKSTGNISYTFSKGSTKTFSATLGPYYHNQDGTLAAKTVTFVVHGDVSGGNHTLTKPVSFTTIPRYFSQTPSISFRSKTNTSITYNWSTSEACDYIAYHLDGGSAVQVWTGNATSGTFTVSGLTGNTTHSVYATCRRRDSQLPSDSNTVSNITTYKTPTITLSCTASDETSLTFKATPSVDIKSKLWILKNSGGTEVARSTDTAESHQFTSLSAGSSYTVYVSCVSNDANGAIQSDTFHLAYSTIAYPTIASVGTAELVIGNAQTISITNPKNRNVTVHMKKDGENSDLQTWTTTTNGNYQFTPTASNLYASIPAAHSANCLYYLTYSTNTSPTKSGKYKIKETENPTFTTSNWSYNVNNTYNSLTGNDTSVVIKGYSTVNFTVGTAATSAYGASFDPNNSSSGYVYNWGDGAAGTVALTKTTTASISAQNTNVIKVTAFDDRSLSTISTRTLTNGTNYVDYASPTINSAKTHRANGIDTATTLTLTGKLGYVGKFGTNGVTNTIASIKYKTKAASSSTWSSEYNLTGYTIDTSTGDFSLTDAQIHANGSSGGFTVGTKYNVMIIVKDAQGLLGSVTYTVDVTDGKIARDVYQDSNGEYHEGINGRADSNYTQKINGTLNVTGNETVGGNVTATGNVSTNGSFQKNSTNILRNNGSATVLSAINNQIVFRPKGDGDTTNQGILDTDGTLTLQKGSVGNLVLKRTDAANASAIRFENTNGMLGAIGFTGTANGRLQRWNKDYANGYEVIDRSIVTNNTSKTHTNYNNNQTNIPTMNTLTYWNGAYNSSNSSNLTYCANGTIHGTNSLGACCVGPNGSINITNTSAWQELKVTMSKTLSNTNTSLFTPTSGGIKVLKAGYYLVSSAVNFDTLDNCSLVLYKNSTNVVTVDQPSSTASMRNIVFPTYLVQCAANDILYMYCRNATARTTLVREGRTYLTVVKIA